MTEAPDRDALRAFRAGEAALDAERRARIDARVGAAIAGELVLEPVGVGSGGTRGPEWWRGWTIAGVAMVATVLIAVVFLRGGDEQGEVRVMSAPPTAEALVHQVEQAPSAALGPSELLHVTRSTTTETGNGPVLREQQVVESWTDADGTVRKRPHDIISISASGTSVATSGGEVIRENWEGWGVSVFTQPQIDQIPATPDGLGAAVDASMQFGDDDRASSFAVVAEVAASPATPAPVRAAALQLMIDSGATYDRDPADVPAELDDIEVVALHLDVTSGPLTVWVDPVRGLVVGHGTQAYTATLRAEIVAGSV